MAELAICTIISKNYLPFARTLAQSFRRFNQGRIFVLLVDRIDGYFKAEDEPLELIEIEQLRNVIPDLDRFCFQYSILELNTGVKPFLLEYLFKEYGLTKLVYLDPDILVSNSLADLSGLLDQYAIILTPHLTAPINDYYKPGEIEILQSGAYNLGFIGMSNTPAVMAMLKWWQERLYSQCIVAIEQGLFVDQKWMDLVPGLFDDVFILRHPGYNVAYWNYHSRQVQMREGQILVNGDPSYFLHFSGFNPEDIRAVSKHQNRFTLDQLKELAPVAELYRDQLISNGWTECKRWPYVFGCFDNGVRIPDVARRAYLEMGDSVRQFGNPFSTNGNDRSFFSWLTENIDGGAPGINRLMYEIYKVRLDIQRGFPDLKGADHDLFVDWVMTSGKHDYQLDDRFLSDVSLPSGGWRRKLSAAGIVRMAGKAKRGLWRGLKKQFGDRHPLIDKLRAWNAVIGKRGEWGSELFRVRKPMADSRTSRVFGVNIAGYIKSEHGVGEAVRGNIRGFEDAGVSYVLNNLTSSASQEDETYTTFCRSNPYQVNFIHVNADQAPAVYQDKGAGYFKGKYNIGYWVWELSKFPDEWMDRFQYFNEIWTASQFCADAISRVSPIPVIRIPHSIAITDMGSKNRSDFGIDERSHVFLFMFDLLSYFERKNPLALIRAFKMAFRANEDVQLVLKVSGAQWNPEALVKVREALQGCRATVIDSVLRKGDINCLISLSDCYVSLHRSEGFGLPLAEAMYLGKPVIATSYSGNMDFMNLNNSFPVKYRLVEIEKDIGPYKAGSVWADPDVDHASELMRSVYEQREASTKIGRVAAADIRNELSPHQIGKMMCERLRCIKT